MFGTSKDNFLLHRPDLILKYIDKDTKYVEVFKKAPFSEDPIKIGNRIFLCFVHEI